MWEVYVIVNTVVDKGNTRAKCMSESTQVVGNLNLFLSFSSQTTYTCNPLIFYFYFFIRANERTSERANGDCIFWNERANERTSERANERTSDCLHFAFVYMHFAFVYMHFAFVYMHFAFVYVYFAFAKIWGSHIGNRGMFVCGLFVWVKGSYHTENLCPTILH